LLTLMFISVGESDLAYRIVLRSGERFAPARVIASRRRVVCDRRSLPFFKREEAGGHDEQERVARFCAVAATGARGKFMSAGLPSSKRAGWRCAARRFGRGAFQRGWPSACLSTSPGKKKKKKWRAWVRGSSTYFTSTALDGEADPRFRQHARETTATQSSSCVSKRLAATPLTNVCGAQVRGRCRGHLPVLRVVARLHRVGT